MSRVLVQFKENLSFTFNNNTSLATLSLSRIHSNTHSKLKRRASISILLPARSLMAHTCIIYLIYAPSISTREYTHAHLYTHSGKNEKAPLWRHVKQKWRTSSQVNIYINFDCAPSTCLIFNLAAQSLRKFSRCARSLSALCTNWRGNLLPATRRECLLGFPPVSFLFALQ